jgi:hypothetical protein
MTCRGRCHSRTRSAGYFFFTNRNFAHRFRCAAAIRLRPAAEIPFGRPGPLPFNRSRTRIALSSRSTVDVASLCCTLRMATTSRFGMSESLTHLEEMAPARAGRRFLWQCESRFARQTYFLADARDSSERRVCSNVAVLSSSKSPESEKLTTSSTKTPEVGSHPAVFSHGWELRLALDHKVKYSP